MYSTFFSPLSHLLTDRQRERERVSLLVNKCTKMIVARISLSSNVYKAGHSLRCDDICTKSTLLVLLYSTHRGVLILCDTVPV